MSNAKNERSRKSRLARSNREKGRTPASKSRRRFQPIAQSLEDRRLLTLTLNIDGTASSDTILFDYVSSLNQIQYSVNGALSVLSVPPELSSIVINGYDGEDSIRVLREPGIEMIIDGGGENDSIIIGQDVSLIDSLRADQIEVRGGEGLDEVLVVDNASMLEFLPIPYYVSSEFIARSRDFAQSTIVDLDSIEEIRLASNDNSNIIYVGSIDAGHTVSIIDAGGSDQLIFNGAESDSLETYHGTFEYKSLGTGGGSAIFHDEASLFDGEYRISATETETFLARNGAVWKFEDILDFSLHSGEGGARFKVESTQAGTSWEVDAGGGDDFLRVTPGRRYSPILVEGGRLNTIRGELTLIGGTGNDEASFDDQFSSAALNYELTDARIAWVGYAIGAARTAVTLHSVEDRRVITGLGSDVLLAGSYSVGNLFDQLSKNVDVVSAGGEDVMTFHDQGAIQGGGYYLNESTTGTGTEYTFQKSLVIPTVPFPLVRFSGLVTMRGDFEIRVMGVASAEFHVDISTARGIYLESEAYSSSTFFIDASGLATGTFFVNAGDDIEDADGNPWTQSLSRVVVTGSEADVAAFRPGRVRSDGILTVNEDHAIVLVNVASLFVEGFDEVRFTTPRGQDEVGISQAPQNIWEAGDAVWAAVYGTSGTVETENLIEPVMLSLHYRNIGTLILDTASRDGWDGVFLYPVPDSQNDLVTLRPMALRSRYAETLRIVMGNGDDRLIDETLLSPITDDQRARLETEFLTPVTHVVAGTASEMQFGSLRALGPDGEMLHEIHASGPARYVVPDPQQLVTFDQANVAVALEAGVDGLQRLRSSHSLSTWDFAVAHEGRVEVQARDNSTVAIIAILLPVPFSFIGGTGPDNLSFYFDPRQSPPSGFQPIELSDFDGNDSITMHALRQIPEGSPVATDFRVDARSAFADADPRVLIELLVHLGSGIGRFSLTSRGAGTTYPQLGFEGHDSPDDSLDVLAPLNSGWNSIELLVRKVDTLAIELLVMGRPDLLTVSPQLDGGLLAGAAVEGVPTLNVLTDNLTRNVEVAAPMAELFYPEPDFREVNFDATRAGEITLEPGWNQIIAILMPRIEQSITQESGRITVGNWSVEHDPYSATSLFGTEIDTILAGDFSADDRELSIEHHLLGSTSTFDIQGRFGGRLDLSVEGAVSNNRIAVSTRDSEFLGGFTLDIDSPGSGTTTAVIGEAGVYYGPGSSRELSINSDGAETLVFLGDSDVRTAPGVVRNTGFELSGAPATILSAAGTGLSPVELYENTGILRPILPTFDARFQSTFGLLPELFQATGQPPALGGTANRTIEISGTGDIAGAAYDSESLTTITAGHAGAFDMTAGEGVELVIPGTQGLDLPPGPLSLFMVINTSDSGPGSLRAALESALLSPGGMTAVIGFAIPASDPNFRDVDSHLPGGDAAPDAFVISPLSALPVNYRGKVVINGASQTTFTGNTSVFGPEVVLAGQFAGATAHGLEIRSSHNRVHGLNVQGFGGNGVLLAGDGNIVTGSYIGTDPSGVSAPGTANGASGVRIVAGSGSVIGGTSPGEGNVISGNQGDGVRIATGTGHQVLDNMISANAGSGVVISGAATTGNLIAGNRIGTDAGGQSDRGNAIMGVWIINAPGNIVRENLISGNDVNGLVIAGSTASGNLAEGNFIGTDLSGTYAIGNVLGIHLADAPNNVVRGNLLSGNIVGLDISGTPATGNIVTGNYIGTGASGNSALPNSADGIFIDDAPGNRIGGPGADEGNVIGGNGFRGVLIEGVGSVGNVVAGNLIGIGADGQTPLGNGMSGIEMAGGAIRNRIGTDGDGSNDDLEGNRIAFNVKAGVSVVGETSRGNTIRGNAISSNAGLGIDLGTPGANSNDATDADTGSNDLQNYPLISNARVSANNVQVNGSLRSTPNTDFVIDFYANSASDPGGYGEGRRWIGSIQSRTDSTGFVSFQFVAPLGNVSRDEWVSATATGLLSGSTSEFSLARQVVGMPAQPPGRGGQGRGEAAAGFVVLDQVAVDAALSRFEPEESSQAIDARTRRIRKVLSSLSLGSGFSN